MQQKLFADAKARSNSFQDSQNSAPFTEETHPDAFLSNTAADVSSRLNQSYQGATEAVSGGQQITSSLFAELSARSDILPIHPLSAPPISSEFRPQVITSATNPVEGGMVTEGAQEVLDLRHIAMSQPVIVLQNGVQHLVSWQTLLSQVAMLPQFSHQSDGGGGEFSIQMPTATPHGLGMQPSFPEPHYVDTVPHSGAMPLTGMPNEMVMSTAFPASAVPDEAMPGSGDVHRPSS